MAKGGGHNKGQTMPYSSLRAFGEKKPMRQGHWSLGAARYSLNESLVAANARGLDLEASIIDRATGEIVWQPAKCGVCRTAWATESRGDDEWSLCRECFELVDEADAEGAAPQPAELENYRRPPAEGMVAAEAISAPIPVLPPKGGLAELIIGESRSGKTSVAAATEFARRLLASNDPFAEAARKLGDDAQLVAMQSAAGEIAALDPLYADCLTRSPDADPSGLIRALDRLNLPRAVWSDETVVARANGMLWRMRAEPHAMTGGPCGVWSAWGPAGCRGHFVAGSAARFIRDRRTP